MVKIVAGSVYSKVLNFKTDPFQSSFGLSLKSQYNSMEGKEKNEQLIGKLIKKRKQENDAFQKLLNALDGKGQPGLNLPKTKKDNEELN